jgi:multidrug resistance efflux pump
MYSYLLLLLFIRFGYNIFHHWFAELALLPAALLAFVIFRSRLRALKSFARNVYDTKAGALRLTPLRGGLGIALLIILFVPILRDRENAYFVIESTEVHQVHAGIPGRVSAIYVKQGETVRTGQVMAILQSLNEAGDREQAKEQMMSSQAHLFAAQLQHSSLGEALTAQRAAQRSSAIAHDESAQLAVVAPADGVVATDDPENLLHRDVTRGETLLRVVDPAHLVARLYVPVSAMDRIRLGNEVSIQIPSQFHEIYGRLGILQDSALPLPPGLLPDLEYKGMVLPAFYTTRLALGEMGDGVRPGMSGEAKIFGKRRSLAQRGLTTLGNVMRTHFW